MPKLTRPTNQPNRYKEIIGTYIKEKRQAAGLTQEELINRIGHEMWFTALSAIERGERNLPEQLWEPTAKALGVPQEEFARILLRYTHPWVYGMVFGFTPAMRAELATIPDRYTEPLQKRRKRQAAE